MKRCTITPTANLLIVELLLNSVVSTPGTWLTTIDIMGFYLNIQINRFKYMKLKLSNLPEDFIDKYQLETKADRNKQINVEVRKGM